MDILLDAQVWASALPDLPQSEVRVFLALAAMSGGDMAITFKNADLIKQSRVCKSLVQRSIWSMHKKGMLKVIERVGGNSCHTTIELSTLWVRFSNSDNDHIPDGFNQMTPRLGEMT